MSKEFKDAMHALRMSGTVMTTAGEDVLRELLARSAPESAEEGPQCVKCGDTGQRRVLDTSQGPDGEYYDVDCECLNAPPVAEPAKCAAKIHPERFIREAADKAAVWSSDCRNIRVLPMSALDTILITLDAMQNHSKPYEDSPDCAQNPAQTGCLHSTPVEGCEWCDVATAAFPELAQREPECANPQCVDGHVPAPPDGEPEPCPDCAQSPAKDEAREVVVPHELITKWRLEHNQIPILDPRWYSYEAVQAIAWDRQQRAQPTGAAEVERTGPFHISISGNHATVFPQAGIADVVAFADWLDERLNAEPQQAQGEQVVAWMKADGSDAVTAEKKKTMLENLGFGGKQLAELYSIALIPADQSGSAPVADSATTGPAALSRLASK